jgi:toxin secretion/phage lysis holin
VRLGEETVVDGQDGTLAWLLGIVAGIGASFGGADPLLRALAVLVALDVATGVLRGMATGTLNSSISWRGGLRKIAIFLAVGLAATMDGVLGGPGEAGILRAATIAYYLASEGLSIVENLGQMGVPFPVQVASALEKLRDTGERPATGKGAGR